MKHIETRTYTDEGYKFIGMFESWNILLDIHNAVLYGYTDCRMPEPGRDIDVNEAEDHVANIEKEWEAEKAKRDFCNDWTGSPPFTSMPLNTKLYLHSILRDAWKRAGVKQNQPRPVSEPF